MWEKVIKACDEQLYSDAGHRRTFAAMKERGGGILGGKGRKRKGGKCQK